MAGEFLLTSGSGDVYSVDEGQQWLHDMGWKALVHKPLAGPASLIVPKLETKSKLLPPNMRVEQTGAGAT